MRERMQDVGQHQFLMLLLVIKADFHQRPDRSQCILAGLVKELHHGGVYVPAVGRDFVGARPGLRRRGRRKQI